ncbi:MAG: HAD-IA family hydrolase [Cyanobacteria bacterium]|nr:HAD-IA family hydrolase [Cyanobacteria bacterium CG_2015-16_32_12]NCO79411.1 HAD-IA family hydrolase [Cyanobacteria bacterium CG_2015-22_32_23]NCQ05668.1 HAD-IA family hydrolase [Cyanobacteria bacterium CG_2015-09_32_10]NCS85731.1 HAD-IA family hydrolase [Cyanobacteria bacterium CG_2015-02_32_10]
MMTLKALIFDVDGTLAQTEKHGHRVAFNLAFQKAGLSWQWDIDLYGDLLEIGGGKERLRHYITHYLPEFTINEPLDQFILSLHRQKTIYYRQLLVNNAIPLRLGVKRLITEAYNQNIKLAIASTASLENVKALLDTSLGEEMSKYFEVIAAGDMVKNKKPAADIYLLALEKLNLSSGECLAIEDTNQGLIAATQAGLKTVITINDYSKNQNFDDAFLVLNSLGEPDLFFQVIKGNNYHHDYFNLELAQKIIEN